MAESPDSEQEVSSISPSKRLKDAFASFLNIGFAILGIEDFRQLDWLHISLITYYLGIFGLTLWSGYILLAIAVNYILSGGLLEGFGKLISTGSMIAILLGLFAGWSRWTYDQIENAHTIDSPSIEFPDQVMLFLISYTSIIAAMLFRYMIIIGIDQNFARDISVLELGAVLIVDLGWISLLLIGVGGFTRLLFSVLVPNEVRNDS